MRSQRLLPRRSGWTPAERPTLRSQTGRHGRQLLPLPLRRSADSWRLWRRHSNRHSGDHTVGRRAKGLILALAVFRYLRLGTGTGTRSSSLRWSKKPELQMEFLQDNQKLDYTTHTVTVPTMNKTQILRKFVPLWHWQKHVQKTEQRNQDFTIYF